MVTSCGIKIQSNENVHHHAKSYFLCFLFAFTSCNEQPKGAEMEVAVISTAQNEAAFTAALQAHLDAVRSKDMTALKATMSPGGEMELIQPGAEILYTVDEFMEFHKEWFDLDNNWTVEIKTVSTDIGERMGTATTEFLYEEPERNGKPYFNRLSVSYALEKIDGQWYIIKDHASSIEKTAS